MSVSSIGSAASLAAMLAASQQTQAAQGQAAGDSPHDGDADDVAVQAAASPGTGTVVDKTA